jgi:hypothetical protein
VVRHDELRVQELVGRVHVDDAIFVGKGANGPSEEDTIHDRLDGICGLDARVEIVGALDHQVDLLVLFEDGHRIVVLVLVRGLLLLLLLLFRVGELGQVELFPTEEVQHLQYRQILT